MDLPSLLSRLRHDFQLSIITLMGILGIVGISPYAVYRLSTGNYLVGLWDSVIVLSTFFAVLYAWRSGDTIKPGIVLSVIFSAGATFITLDLGINGLFWIYPLILFNFFMVTPGKALLTMAVVLLTLCGHELWKPQSVFESLYQMLSFLVTSLMASTLTFVFAYRTRHQHQLLHHLASKDPLTGARNRRSMAEELKIAVASKMRHGHSHAVLALDLDHFKQINDRFGHAAGDQVLQDFVSLVRRCSRKQDRLFRLGGEEFLLLLPDTDHKGLHAAAEHLLYCVREQLRSPGGSVSVSMGGALLETGESWESWLHRADEQLYNAKHSGRDRCVIAEAQAPATLVNA